MTRDQLQHQDGVRAFCALLFVATVYVVVAAVQWAVAG